MRFLRAMSPRTRKIIDWVVGLTLIFVGIIGGFLPILQGWAFILLGLGVLSRHSRLARAIYERIKSLGRRVRERLRSRRVQARSSSDRASDARR